MKEILSSLLFQVFLSVMFYNVDVKCVLKTKRIDSSMGGGVVHDFCFLHYSILYFLKLFHGTYMQIFIVRKKKQ